MGWITMTLRKTELKSSINDRNLKIMKLQRQLTRLTSFANSIGDGVITPSEIAGLGMSLFGEGLDFMNYGNAAAMDVAQQQTDAYVDTYQGISQESYLNNPALAAQAQLYFDEDGNLNEDAMFNEFYEQALKEYAEEEILPLLNEKQKEIENEKTEEETLLEEEESELQALGQSISSQIQSNAPKYA